MKMLPKKDVGLTNQSFNVSDPTEVGIKPDSAHKKRVEMRDRNRGRKIGRIG